MIRAASSGARRASGRSRLAALLTVGALAVVSAIGLSPATDAAAAASELELSLDGVHWSTALPAGIFDPDRRLVPGDRIEGTFFVRNNSAERAWLRVGVSRVIVSSMELALSVNLTTVATTPSGASGSTAALGSSSLLCTDMLERDETIPAGGTARVDTALWFRPSVPGTVAQDSGAALTFIVELMSAGLPAPTAPLCDPAGAFSIGPPPAPLAGPDDVDYGEPTSPDPSGTAPSGGDDAGAISGGDSDGGTGGSLGGSNAEASGGSPVPATGSIGGGFSAGSDDTATSIANSARLGEEYAILILIGAALAGAIAGIAARRHSKGDPA